jgi:hypothetical protein
MPILSAREISWRFHILKIERRKDAILKSSVLPKAR